MPGRFREGSRGNSQEPLCVPDAAELLDDRSRELVRLKFTEELSYKEIGARTGLSVGNVGFILHHALKAIAEELAKNGVVK